MNEIHDEIFTRADWDAAVKEGWITRRHIEERLRRLAIREFGEPGPASYDQEGFFTALTSTGETLEGIGRFQVYSNDHNPPHIHVRPAGHDRKIDLKFSLETGDLLSETPQGVKSKSIKTIKNVILENRDTFQTWWDKGRDEPLTPAS